MGQTLTKIGLALCIFMVCCCSNSAVNLPKKKLENIESFLKTVVADTLEEDYKKHNINITVVVTNLKIDRITRKDTYSGLAYFAQGRVSYIIKGKRQWRDKEGNLIRLGPEEEITHWFSSGVLEDGYGLYKDTRNRLTFYADNPMK